MTENGEREVLRLLNRLVESTERLEVHFAGERPKPAPPAEIPRDLVTAVPLFHRDPRQEPSEFPSSTTTREKFWSEGDR